MLNLVQNEIPYPNSIQMFYRSLSNQPKNISYSMAKIKEKKDHKKRQSISTSLKKQNKALQI